MLVVVKNLFETIFLIHRIIIKLLLTSYHAFDLSKGKKMDVENHFLYFVVVVLI